MLFQLNMVFSVKYNSSNLQLNHTRNIYQPNMQQKCRGGLPNASRGYGGNPSRARPFSLCTVLKSQGHSEKLTAHFGQGTLKTQG